MLIKLKHLQEAAGVMSTGLGNEPFVENEGQYDEVGEAASANQGTQAHLMPGASDVTAVERELLTMPSNANVVGNLHELEVRHRIKQARREVHRLRDIIADISFQYSHVIRGAIRKSVRTTSQKHVKSLHRDLVLHARIYTRCRSRLIALDCDENWLRIFQVLTKSDLKASTAILRPNIPGSSSLQLSWIWQTGRWYLVADPNADADADADADSSPTSLLECPCHTSIH